MSCFFFSELTQIVTDVVADPTLPRTEDHECPKYVNFSFWLNLTHKLAEFLSTFLAVSRRATGFTDTQTKKELSSRSMNQTGTIILTTDQFAWCLGSITSLCSSPD